jgi:hypothetical protein
MSAASLLRTITFGELPVTRKSMIRTYKFKKRKRKHFRFRRPLNSIAHGQVTGLCFGDEVSIDGDDDLPLSSDAMPLEAGRIKRILTPLVWRLFVLFYIVLLIASVLMFREAEISPTLYRHADVDAVGLITTILAAWRLGWCGFIPCLAACIGDLI